MAFTNITDIENIDFETTPLTFEMLDTIIKYILETQNKALPHETRLNLNDYIQSRLKDPINGPFTKNQITHVIELIESTHIDEKLQKIVNSLNKEKNYNFEENTITMNDLDLYNTGPFDEMKIEISNTEIIEEIDLNSIKLINLMETLEALTEKTISQNALGKLFSYVLDTYTNLPTHTFELINNYFDSIDNEEKVSNKSIEEIINSVTKALATDHTWIQLKDLLDKTVIGKKTSKNEQIARENKAAEWSSVVIVLQSMVNDTIIYYGHTNDGLVIRNNITYFASKISSHIENNVQLHPNIALGAMQIANVYHEAKNRGMEKQALEFLKKTCNDIDQITSDLFTWAAMDYPKEYQAEVSETFITESLPMNNSHQFFKVESKLDKNSSDEQFKKFLSNLSNRVYFYYTDDELGDFYKTMRRLEDTSSDFVRKVIIECQETSDAGFEQQLFKRLNEISSLSDLLKKLKDISNVTSDETGIKKYSKATHFFSYFDDDSFSFDISDNDQVYCSTPNETDFFQKTSLKQKSSEKESDFDYSKIDLNADSDEEMLDINNINGDKNNGL